MTWVFELHIFKLRTLLMKVYPIINSTFSNNLRSTISGFDFHSNEVIDMHLGSTLQRSCMDLPSSGLRPFCYAELFWGWCFPLWISLPSSSSWSTEQCVVGTLRPKVASQIIFPLENQARVVARSYFISGRSCLLSRILPQVWLEPWLHIRRLAKIGFP